MVSEYKVLMISPQFKPLVGGYERAAERLSKALAKLGLAVVVITERRDQSWSKVEFVDGFTIQRHYCCYRRYFHSITSVLALSAYLLTQGRKFTIWHIHQYGLQAAIAIAFGQLLNKPVVMKLTSSKNMGISQSLGHGVKGRILRYWHKKIGACIAVSQETYYEAIAFGIPQERVHLIPNGVDADQFYPSAIEEKLAARKALKLECQKMVLFVGRLSPEKNLAGLIDAWNILANDVRANTLLVIIGNGPERSNIEHKIELLGLEQSIYLAGNQSNVELWYRAADIYVICSFREGLSNSMLEALASGLPVISTRVSGSSILLDQEPSGFVVDIDNKIQFSEALTTLLSDSSLRSRMSKNARKIFELQFSLTEIAKQTICIYKKLTNSSYFNTFQK